MEYAHQLNSGGPALFEHPSKSRDVLPKTLSHRLPHNWDKHVRRDLTTHTMVRAIRACVRQVKVPGRCSGVGSQEMASVWGCCGHYKRPHSLYLDPLALLEMLPAS